MAATYQVQAINAFNDNYIWLIRQPGNRHCVLVDPGDGDSACRAVKEQGLTLAAILITHHHQDHTGGVHQLRNDVPLGEGFIVYGPAREARDVVDRPLTEGDAITIDALDLHLQILDIPGHTLGHIAYLDDHSLFCGDTLFAGGCGRIFEGTAEQMHQSLQKLAALPAATRVYCAHEYTLANLAFADAVEPGNDQLQQRIRDCRQRRAQEQATVPSDIATELATNPFLRAQSPEVQASARRFNEGPLESDSEIFAAIRRWKDQF